MDKKQKIICIIQARMSANRLPGKVLEDICGHPMLYWVVSRAGEAKRIDDLVVATTSDDSDDPIAAWCKENNINCFRGDAFDVLDRYYQAAKKWQADVIVRLTADCPLIDPELIDMVIEAFFEHKVDFAANRLPPPYKRTYPIGLDIEVTSFAALEKAWKMAKLPFEREHVMPYLYSVEDRFNIHILNAAENQGSRRWTVDTPEDLEFIRTLFSKKNCKIYFSWKEVLHFLDENPDLERINAEVAHKSYRDVDSRSKFQ
ncbi:MAG: glycosyltransferase family protein [Methanosarcinaceae archaeon]|nr:glycosyltransferase family protein [Methanosarcinaceae archaeon]